MPEIAIGLPLIQTQAVQAGRGTAKGSEDTCVLPDDGEFAGLLEQMKGKGEIKSKIKSSADTEEGSGKENKESDQKNEYMYCICSQIPDTIIPQIRLLNDGSSQNDDKIDLSSEALTQQPSAVAPGLITQEAFPTKAAAESAADLNIQDSPQLIFNGQEAIQIDANPVPEQKSFVKSSISDAGEGNIESALYDATGKLQDVTDLDEASNINNGSRTYDTGSYDNEAIALPDDLISDSVRPSANVKYDFKAKVQAEAGQSDIQNKKELKPQENIKKIYDTPKEKAEKDFLYEHNVSAFPEKTTAVYQNPQNVREEIIEARPETQITQAINENLSKGRDRFTVKLKPEGLGEVTVRLALDGDTLAVSIRSSEHSTNDLLGSRLDELRSSLEEGGCKVGLLNLETQAQGGESSREGHSSSQRASPKYDEADHSVSSEGGVISEVASRVIGYKSGIINYRV